MEFFSPFGLPFSLNKIHHKGWPSKKSNETRSFLRLSCWSKRSNTSRSFTSDVFKATPSQRVQKTSGTHPEHNGPSCRQHNRRSRGGPLRFSTAFGSPEAAARAWPDKPQKGRG